MIPGFQLIDKELVSETKRILDKAGIYYRIFSRVKDIPAIEEKLIRKSYSGEKKMQDVFGIRIITYFYDDIEIIYNHLRIGKTCIDEQVDIPELTVFEPKRTNLIFKLSKHLSEIFTESLAPMDLKFGKLLDQTFELQLRTIFSEGWHEIDHSLRYKSKDNWYHLPKEERIFNGIFASLEISDHILSKLFDDMAYTHFKKSRVESLIRTKFRLKFGTDHIDKELLAIFDKNNSIVKNIYKLDREEVVNTLLKQQVTFPLNLNNFIYFLNGYWLNNQAIWNLTPSALSEDFTHK